MTVWLWPLLALISGIVLPLQAGINAQLRSWLAQPVLAAFVSFGVGTIALLGYSLALRLPWPETGRIVLAPWWVWTGGLLGAFFVWVNLTLAPKLGATVLVGFIVAGQMLASLLMDHFGVVGYHRHPIGLWRLLGVVMILSGVILIRKF